MRQACRFPSLPALCRQVCPRLSRAFTYNNYTAFKIH
jgi:hypothetical protein